MSEYYCLTCGGIYNNSEQCPKCLSKNLNPLPTDTHGVRTMMDCKESATEKKATIRSEHTQVKHGIRIQEHKNWNTKTVYNHGHVMRTYRRQPKVLRFKSAMVNDFNQHLCGGWSMVEIGDQEEATINQLLIGRKPFGLLAYWPDSYSKAVEAHERLSAAGLATVLDKQKRPNGCWCVHACHKIRVWDIGDLQALEADYDSWFTPGFLSDGILDFAHRELSAFFHCWDVESIPIWLTGLILGYPVENTMSICHEWGIKSF